MLKLYSRIFFKNRPDKKSPLNQVYLNKIDKAIDDIDNRVVDISGELAVERARVDNLTANSGEQTEGNTELIDIRVGADGETYATAGEAVRSQIGILTSKIGALSVVDGALCVTFEETE